MKEKACIELFAVLFEYPTLALLDKTVACQNILEKESPDSSNQLSIFLNCLFDTPFYKLELAFTRSPHRRVNRELRQCYEKYRHGMISTGKGSFSEEENNQKTEDFYRFVRSLPLLSTGEEIKCIIHNFVLPVLQIIRNQFRKTLMINDDKKDNRHLFFYRHAFYALSKALSEKAYSLNSEESLLETFSINPLIVTQSQQVAASAPFISKN